MDPLIQIYIDKLARNEYSNALQELEIRNLKDENEGLKKELEEYKENNKISEDEKQGDIDADTIN